MKSIINDVSTYYAGRHYNITVNGETTQTQKTYAFGSLAVAVRNDGVLKWLLGDHLGSTSITLNADGRDLCTPEPRSGERGTFSSEIRYSAFGEVRHSSGTTPTNCQQ